MLFKGARLLSEFAPFKPLVQIVKYHHFPWDYGKGLEYKGEVVPLASHIIHLADRVCIRIDRDINILTQLPSILEATVEGRDKLFRPEFVDTLFELSKKEFIWLDLVSDSPVNLISNPYLFETIFLNIDEIIDLAHLISQIIDFRSRFTASHSAGVAVVAAHLAELIGFSHIECKMMLIAGYLHDLGKIAISNEVLEKPVKLNEEEFNEMRAHAYYTFQMLKSIPQFNIINQWASLHHERLDGKGYPFHYNSDLLPLGSRIMAVADVFTAITEDRPYRKGMEKSAVREVLNNMVENGALDQYVVGVLLDHYDEINNLRIAAQEEKLKHYQNFIKSYL
jgi:HD-GYP domain-containing protein (c-di-GMP phosphodiesterase class II)